MNLAKIDFLRMLFDEGENISFAEAVDVVAVPVMPIRTVRRLVAAVNLPLRLTVGP